MSVSFLHTAECRIANRAPQQNRRRSLIGWSVELIGVSRLSWRDRHRCNTVLPSSFSSAPTFAPCSHRTRTTSTLPFPAVMCNGVELSLVRVFTSAPCSNSIRTSLTLPPFVAPCNGALPSLSSALTFAPCSSSTRTASTPPFSAATCNGTLAVTV